MQGEVLPLRSRLTGHDVCRQRFVRNRPMPYRPSGGPGTPPDRHGGVPSITAGAPPETAGPALFRSAAAWFPVVAWLSSVCAVRDCTYLWVCPPRLPGALSGQYSYSHRLDRKAAGIKNKYLRTSGQRGAAARVEQPLHPRSVVYGRSSHRRIIRIATVKRQHFIGETVLEAHKKTVRSPEGRRCR